MKKNGEFIKFLKQKDYIMLDSQLGGGSFGIAVLLSDPFIDELFVAKKYEPEEDDIKKDYYKNFLEEIKILHKLNHPNIVRVYNYYAYENNYTGYILMEYIDGNNIREFFNQYSSSTNSVKLDGIFSQLIEAFCYIEKNGIIHRDIREGNILINREGVVKIIDFGIGKRYEAHGSNDDSLIDEINRESSDTLPQEYYDGVYTSQTDMFYLAELFNRLLVESGTNRQECFAYQSFLDKMMEKNPVNRYLNFEEVKKAIDELSFSTLEISDDDKNIYQTFVDGIDNALSIFVDERKFNNDIDKFQENLNDLLRLNSFEDEIPIDNNFIRCIVESGFKYYKSYCIPKEEFVKFFEWYRSSSIEFKKLILDNIIHKLSGKDVEIEIDMPF